jgi:hypothetical protein
LDNSKPARRKAAGFVVFRPSRGPRDEFGVEFLGFRTAFLPGPKARPKPAQGKARHERRPGFTMAKRQSPKGANQLRQSNWQLP